MNNTRGLLLLPILMGYIDIPGGVPFGQPPKGLSMAAFGLHPAMADKKWWNSPEVKARRLDKDELPLCMTYRIRQARTTCLNGFVTVKSKSSADGALTSTFGRSLCL